MWFSPLIGSQAPAQSYNLASDLPFASCVDEKSCPAGQYTAESQLAHVAVYLEEPGTEGSRTPNPCLDGAPKRGSRCATKPAPSMHALHRWGGHRPNSIGPLVLGCKLGRTSPDME
jgi:hypothetical protein